MAPKRAFSRYFKKVDFFGKSVGLTIDGEESYKTFLGAILSLCILTLVMTQLMQKAEVLLQRGDTQHMSTIEFGKRNTLEKLDYNTTGYNFAFGLLSKNYKEMYNIDHDQDKYLHLEVMQILKTNSNADKKKILLEFRRCRASDSDLFSYDEQMSNIYLTFQRHIESFYCLENPHEWEVLGSQQEGFGNHLTISVFRCMGSDCKSEQEIDDYIDSHQFMIVENKVGYESHSYDDQALKSYIDMPASYPLNNQIFFRNFQQNLVESKESYVGLYLLNKVKEHHFFSLEDTFSRPSDAIVVRLQYQQSADIRHYERSVYNVLDLLGDIGGLADALFQICSVIISIISFFSKSTPMSFIIENLFTTQGKKQFESNTFSQKLQQLRSREPYKQSRCLWLCLSKAKEKRHVKMATQRVEKELDVVRYLRTQMLTHIQVDLLYTKLERYLLRKNRVYVMGTQVLSSSDEGYLQDLAEHKLKGQVRESKHLKKLLAGAIVVRRIKSGSAKDGKDNIGQIRHQRAVEVDPKTRDSQSRKLIHDISLREDTSYSLNNQY